MKIVPMLLSSMAGVPVSTVRYGAVGSAEPLNVPMYAYLVESDAGELLVFDLGPYPAEEARRFGRRLGDVYRTPAQAVSDLGRDPADVGVVVISHLHWDHCVGIGGFPNARILVQREEVRYAFAPDPEQWHPYDSWELGRRPPWLEDMERIEPLDGFHRLGDGLLVVPTPGHTPGSQSLLVEADCDFLLCGDLMMSYENWLGLDGPRGGRTSRLPPGIHTSLGKWRASMDLIDQRGWLPLPAHDPRVVDVVDGGWPALHR